MHGPPPRIAIGRVALALCALACSATHAADIGGYLEQQSRNAAPVDECPTIIAQAARTTAKHADAPQVYYASGLCHLHSERVARDLDAAEAWLQLAADLEHPLAKRALLGLRDGNASHPRGYHCHELGLGRRLCHGGPLLP